MIPHMAIAASAGSGKTFQLARRYLTLLAHGVTPDRIIALTFSRKAAGEIAWWAFEAVTLKLAHDTRLTVDFTLMLADGALQMHDVKGGKGIITDDAKAKMKVAARLFPWPFFYVLPKAGGWGIIEVKP